MVVRKLTANPPASQDQYPELASRLIELGETYLNPRLIAREKHGAVGAERPAGDCIDARSASVTYYSTGSNPRCSLVPDASGPSRCSTLVGTPRAGSRCGVRRCRSQPETTERPRLFDSGVLGMRRMPAQRMGTTAFTIGRFDVVGQDALGVAEFVGHVALASERLASYTSAVPLSVLHMHLRLSDPACVTRTAWDLRD